MAKWTRKQLDALTNEQILDVAMKQEDFIDKQRGYYTGITRERFARLGRETLIDCIMADQKTFNIPKEQTL